MDSLPNTFYLFSEKGFSSKKSGESHHDTKEVIHPSTNKFSFEIMNYINIENESIFDDHDDGRNKKNDDDDVKCNPLHNSNVKKYHQKSLEKFHNKVTDEATKNNSIFPLSTNEQFYSYTYKVNQIGNIEIDNSKERLPNLTDDTSLSVMKDVKKNHFLDEDIKIDVSKTLSKHQFISGGEFTNLKRKVLNPDQSFVHLEALKSFDIAHNENPLKETVICVHPLEVKIEEYEHDIQSTFNEELLNKSHSVGQNIHYKGGADSSDNGQLFQQQRTATCTYTTPEDPIKSKSKHQNKNITFTEDKFEEILNKNSHVPIEDIQEELNNVELNNVITKITEHLPEKELFYKPTLEDVVIATANYALDLNTLAQNNNNNNELSERDLETACIKPEEKVKQETNAEKNMSHNEQTSHKKSSNCIKRPQNGFIRYSVEKRAEVAAKNPHLDNRNISCVLGTQWKLLSKEHRDEYQQKFEAEMKDLRKEHPDWMYSNKKNDVDIALEVMPTRLRPAEKRKKKVLDIFEETPTKKKIMTKKRTTKRIPGCKENLKNFKCQKCKNKRRNNKKVKSKEKKVCCKEENIVDDDNDEDNSGDTIVGKLVIEEPVVSAFNISTMPSQFPLDNINCEILQENKTYLPPEMNWSLQLNTEYSLLDSLFQPSTNYNQIVF